MKALIFGINGQDGFYLTQLLENLNYIVIGVSRSNKNFIIGDVSDYNFVENIINEHKPGYIFHLAANSTVKHAALFENHLAIDTGTINILEACYKYGSNSRIFLSGSGVQFYNNGSPIDEQTPFSSLSPYAVSRISSVYTARYYRSLNLKVYVGYLFNHDSPLRTDRHINKKIVSAALNIARGNYDILEIGDLNAKKEFNYAGDVVRAIWTLVNQDKYYEAVIGSGKAFSVGEWIEACFRIIGRDWKKYVIKKEGFKSEYEILVSCPTRIFSMGWRPEVDFKQLAELMMAN